MTYLIHKREGKLEWTDNVEARGMMWASPGPYVRRSMLVTLARKVSDFYLPEAFYEHTTFSGSETSVDRSSEEEELLATELALRMTTESDGIPSEGNDEDESGDNSEDGFD